MTDVEVNLPMNEFDEILKEMAKDFGNISLQEALETGKLQDYVDRYKERKAVDPD